MAAGGGAAHLEQGRHLCAGARRRCRHAPGKGLVSPQLRGAGGAQRPAPVPGVRRRLEDCRCLGERPTRRQPCRRVRPLPLRLDRVSATGQQQPRGARGQQRLRPRQQHRACDPARWRFLRAGRHLSRRAAAGGRYSAYRPRRSWRTGGVSADAAHLGGQRRGRRQDAAAQSRHSASSADTGHHHSGCPRQGGGHRSRTGHACARPSIGRGPQPDRAHAPSLARPRRPLFVPRGERTARGHARDRSAGPAARHPQLRLRSRARPCAQRQGHAAARRVAASGRAGGRAGR